MANLPFRDGLFAKNIFEIPVFHMKIDVQVPDGVSGDWRVERFTVTEEDSRRTLIRSWRDEYVPAGSYVRLMRGRCVVMSNTPMEVRTNQAIIRAASGQVLLNGLGIGMVLSAILQKPEVDHVTVVEKHAEVIELVSPSYKDPRVTIIHSDALTYKPEGRFNAVWHDIWDYICADNLPEMKTLHRRYGKRTDWQASWCRERC